MIISLNWLKKYAKVDLDINDLSRMIGARLVEIEDVVDLSEKYKDAIIVKVINAGKIEGSDHLSLVKIDDTGLVPNVERDSDGYIQVVCGAPNIATGQVVVWLPPQSIVPSTYNSADQFKLDVRPLRGYMSNGMIASCRELDLSDEHEGILVLDVDAKIGQKLSDYLNLDDYLLDIENKSLTHRPDCFGIVGFAREVAGIQGLKFETPEWLDEKTELLIDKNASSNLTVKVIDPELSSRYTAVVINGVDNTRKSPLIIQSYLSRIGLRPISAVVDVTNYLMMLTGQPLHAFDYDKLVAVSGGKPEISVRAGKKGEMLELLDGRNIELSVDDIVIAAGDKAIGLAGAMGGLSTAIDDSTKNIIIESATFNLYNLRATQMRHGIFSEAITRFTKGQPAGLAKPVIIKAVELINEWAGLESVSEIVEDYPAKQNNELIELSLDQVNNVLGTNYSSVAEIKKTLENVGFTAQENGDILLKVAVPYWRGDIHIPEDIIEEIGRLNGFDNINPVLPMRDFTAVMPSKFDGFRSRVRKILTKAGANEVLSYSFVHGDILKKSNQNPDNSYKIVNSISPDLQYYRQSLTPSLLGMIHPNIKQGYDELALFELNKTHQKLDGLNDEGVPVESEMMALVVAGKHNNSGAAYYQAKKFLDYLLESLGVEAEYVLADDSQPVVLAPFEQKRSAKIVDMSGNVIGVIGEFKRQVTKSFKLPEFAAGFEINNLALFDSYSKVGKSYVPISKYPSVERDVCFKVNSEVQYSDIIKSAKEALKSVEMETSVMPIDIYQPQDGLTKNITIRVKMTSHSQTLTSEQAAGVMGQVEASVTSATDGKVI